MDMSSLYWKALGSVTVVSEGISCHYITSSLSTLQVYGMGIVEGQTAFFRDDCGEQRQVYSFIHPILHHFA